MEAPLTQYALRDGVHVGYQVWGQDPAGTDNDTVDVLEFNSGLMISIDETVDEPNWLRYTERVAAFSRLLQKATGYVATVKRGTVTFEHGEATGALPGRLVRGAR